MTKKIRRTLSLLLTLTLIFSQLPQSAFAVSAEGNEPISINSGYASEEEAFRSFAFLCHHI